MLKAAVKLINARTAGCASCSNILIVHFRIQTFSQMPLDGLKPALPSGRDGAMKAACYHRREQLVGVAEQTGGHIVLEVDPAVFFMTNTP